MRTVEIATSEGRAPAWFFEPAGAGPWPGILFFMDAIGPRPALASMAERLAGEGYRVLLPDLYYRAGPWAPFDAATVMTDDAQRARMIALHQSLDDAAAMRDVAACLDFLATEPAVRGPGIGCLGYCMGGRLALLAAGHFPERICAAASFHGAGLASEGPGSPHRLAGAMRAALYVGVAETDPWLEPGETERLRAALAAAGLEHTVEIYPGTRHGFAVPDVEAHDRSAAERHWQRLLEHFGRTLVPVRAATGRI